MSYPLLKFKKNIIKEVSDHLDLSQNEIDLERPSKERGDFAIPCFQFAQVLKEDPKSIAASISEEIDLKNGYSEAVGPYLNFYIDQKYLAKETIKSCVNKKSDYGQFPSNEKKLLIEHTSANPNGPLHVGRARNPIIGDTLARTYSKAGYDVEKQYYVNDIGRQIAILTWGIENLEENDLPETKREKSDHELVRYYQKANELLEEDEELEEEINEIIRSMEDGDEKIFSALKKNSDKVLSGIMESLIRLNITLDSTKHESTFIEEGSVKDTISNMAELDNTREKDKALYYKMDEREIFLTREDGTNLYPLRDIAYHLWKAKHADKLINILGEDHKTHGEFIKKTLNELGVDIIPEIIFHSFVTFEGKEMSTRKGEYVDLDEFMDTAIEKAKQEIVERRDDLSEEKINDIATKIGLSSVRYNIVKVQPSKPIDFKWKEALNFQGNSAPFIQYSYARANSILERSDDSVPDIEDIDLDSLNLEEGEVDLIRKIANFPLMILEVIENDSPHLLAQCAYELAAEFNQFYRDFPVLQAKNKKNIRLKITECFTYCMASTLNTLGLEKPKIM